MRLINQFGQRVWQKKLGEVREKTQKIDLHTFQNGLYFLQIQVAGRKPMTKKLLINRLY